MLASLNQVTSSEEHMLFVHGDVLLLACFQKHFGAFDHFGCENPSDQSNRKTLWVASCSSWLHPPLPSMQSSPPGPYSFRPRKHRSFLSIPSLEHSPWCCQPCPPNAGMPAIWTSRVLVGAFFVGIFFWWKNQWKKNLSFHFENVYKSCNTVGCWTDLFVVKGVDFSVYCCSEMKPGIPVNNQICWLAS